MRRTLPPFVKPVARKGRVYYYFRVVRDGKEYSTRLPDNPDSPEFSAAYWAVRSGKQATKPERQTWAELIEAYRKSRKFRGLAERTRKSYSDVLDLILAANATKAVAKTTRQHVRAVHAKYEATPRKADWIIQVLSILFNFARLELDWSVSNAAEGIRLYGKQREFEPWPDWMVAKLPAAPQIVRTAAELILGTGQRPNAAVRMRRDQFLGEWMVVHDEKTDTALEVYCPTSLQTYIAGLPVSGAYVLSRNLTTPLGYDAIEKAFRAWRATLGDRARKYSLHGLRKLAIIRLAEAGCTDAQIQAITGQSAEMVAYYRAKANRKALSKAGMRLLENRGATCG